MPEPLPDVASAASFEEASELVLGYLRRALPLSFWAVTRVEEDRQTYLFLGENGYGLEQGGSHPWQISYCRHMVAGRTPTVALDAQAVPEYAAAGVNELVRIGAYAGAPVREPDGTLFGAICGLDPERRVDDAALEAAAPVLNLLGQLLTMALAADRTRAHHGQALLADRVRDETDPLTGLLSPTAWTRVLAEEEQLFARFADPTVVAVLDLDPVQAADDRADGPAGEEYVRRAARALEAAVQDDDQVARLADDEFGILMRGCTEVAAGQAVERIQARLAEHEVSASVGWAPISVRRGLPAALAEAAAASRAARR